MPIQLSFPVGCALVAGGAGQVGMGVTRRLAEAGLPVTFTYAGKNDEVHVMSYYTAPEEAMESPAEMVPWARRALAAAVAARAKAPARKKAPAAAKKTVATKKTTSKPAATKAAPRKAAATKVAATKAPARKAAKP